MKAIVCIALLLVASQAYYVTIGVDCCAVGNYWDGSECTACNSNCSDCSLTVEAQNQNGLDDCTCSGSNCTGCDANGCTSCDDGFILGSNSECYECDDDNCTSCGSNKETCTACASAYALVSGSCVACSLGCSSCTAADTCSSCADGYFISTGAGCLACPSDCKSCTENTTEGEANTCNVCMDTFYLDADGACQSCGIAGSVSCTINTDGDEILTTCQAGYAEGENVCTLCAIDCEGTCTNANECDDCGDGNFLDSDDTTCKACVAGCAECADDANGNLCTACITSTITETVGNSELTTYYSQASDNTACYSGCSAATATGVCAECADGYYADTNKCTACGATDGPCLVCTDGSTCTDCSGVAGNKLVDDGCAVECQHTDDTGTNAWGCTYCLTVAAAAFDADGATTTYICAACATGFYKNGNGTDGADGKVLCIACGDNCDVCTSSGCTTCTVVADDAQGYKNDGDGSCSTCPDNCNTCSTAGVCSVCVGERYVNAAGECGDCPDNCAACTAGVTDENVEVGICSSCLTDDDWVLQDGNCDATLADNCSSGTTQGGCDVCADEYYLAKASCTSCGVDGCAACTVAGTCTTCMAEYVLAAGACTACPTNCFQCSSATNCNATYCADGFFADAANGCTACMANCTTCTAAATCSGGCESGFAFVSAACTACPANCGTCEASGSSVVCSTGGCNDNYFLSEGACNACMTNCKTCTANTSCGTCADGYFYDSANTSCKSCASNCGTCTVENECAATGCNDGYTFMSETSTCAATLTIADCASAQYLEDNVCGDCGDNCTACDADDCTMCEDGYGPNAADNGCSACTSDNAGMTTCATDLTTATACESGYSLIGSVCTECTVTNCMTCTATAATCTACMAGYGMSETGDACNACTEGCAACSSNCERSCTMCLGTGRTAPNCSCSGSTPVWNATAMTCDGETEPESETEPDTSDSSANILKFAVIVLIALLALL